MSSISISIWSNESDAQNATFAEGFSADLKKCIARYLPDYSVEINKNVGGGFKEYVILSKSAMPEPSSDLKKTINSKNKSLQFIHIEPVEQVGWGGDEQPILFWDKQYETGEERLYRRDSNLTKAGYWEKITDLAIDLQSSLSAPGKATAKTKVYLSVDDISHNADRENLKRDLNDLGYEVLPSKPLSPDFEECTHQITEDLSSSSIIIHIIPPIYNIHFIDSHLSLTEHQCNLSAKLVQDGKSDVVRIIWIPSAYEVTDEENLIFIEKIQRDQDQTHNTMVLKSSIEDLKKYYRQVASSSSEGYSDKEADVYIVADDNQMESNLKQALSGLKLRMPSDYKGITFTQHLRELANAKSVVVSFTGQSKQWLAVKANDILKSKGIDLAKQFDKIVLYKDNRALDTLEHEGVFTDVVNDVSQLEETIKQNSNNKNT